MKQGAAFFLGPSANSAFGLVFGRGAVPRRGRQGLFRKARPGLRSGIISMHLSRAEITLESGATCFWNRSSPDFSLGLFRYHPVVGLLKNKPSTWTIHFKAIRQIDNRPYTKKQRKPINPKQDKAKPGPPSHGETTMARANGMSRCRSTCPRNVKFSNRGSEPRNSIEWQPLL